MTTILEKNHKIRPWARQPKYLIGIVFNEMKGFLIKTHKYAIKKKIN